MTKKAQTKNVSIGFRVKPATKSKLDRLCQVNGRSIPDLLEILIDKNYAQYLGDKNTRINP